MRARLFIAINSSNKVEVISSGHILKVTMKIDPIAGDFIPYEGVAGFTYDTSTGELSAFGPVADINKMFEKLRFALADPKL